MKKIRGIYTSPFLLLDYAGPADFTPANRPRGVGQHPHRGAEIRQAIRDFQRGDFGRLD